MVSNALTWPGVIVRGGPTWPGIVAGRHSRGIVAHSGLTRSSIIIRSGLIVESRMVKSIDKVNDLFYILSDVGLASIRKR